MGSIGGDEDQRTPLGERRRARKDGDGQQGLDLAVQPERSKRLSLPTMHMKPLVPIFMTGRTRQRLARVDGYHSQEMRHGSHQVHRS
jgi:hypothetical protein